MSVNEIKTNFDYKLNRIQMETFKISDNNGTIILTLNVVDVKFLAVLVIFADTGFVNKI